MINGAEATVMNFEDETVSGELGHGLSLVKALINVTRFEAAFLPELLPSSDSPLPFHVPKIFFILHDSDGPRRETRRPI